MKTVFNSSELAHIWAKQTQQEGRTSSNNFRFSGRDIYSYGSHFCIARIVRPNSLAFMTMRTYSNTTHKHVNSVGHAINHLDIVRVPFPDCMLYDGARGWTNVQYWTKDLENLLEKVTGKGYHEKTRVYALERAREIVRSITQYLEVTGQKIMERKMSDRNRRDARELLACIETVNSDNVREAYTAARAKAAKQIALDVIKQEKAERARIAKIAALVPAWFAGERVTDYYGHNPLAELPSVYLRISKTEGQTLVETSKGARVSLKAARILFAMLRVGKDVKGHVIDGYTVIGINGTLQIGCHVIERDEVNRFAASQGWQGTIAKH